MFRRKALGPAAVVATYAVAVAAVLGVATGPAASRPLATVITVTAGKPSEWAFTLSKKTAPVGTVVFNVTNRGARPHRFKVCAAPVATAKANACAGKATRVLAPGKSASLTVVFAKAGRYEYLCTSGAARGMKGLLTLVAAAPAKTTTTKTTTTTASGGGSTAPTPTPPTTSAPSGGAASSGSAAAGLVVFNAVGCSNCHTIDDIKGLGGVDANFNSVHPLPFDTGPLTAKQISDLAAYIASK